MMPDGSTYTYHFDSRGSTIAMTDGSGNIANQICLRPLRQQRIGAVEGTPNPFGYVGRYGVMEEGNGLEFMRARYYDEATGRFLNKDLIPGDITEPQSLNRYAYVLDDPVNDIDPFGLVDLNLLPPGSDEYNEANAVTSPPGVFTVASHGNPDWFSYPNHSRLSPEKLAEMIRRNPKYKPGMTVRADSCDTARSPGGGRPSPAQRLANALGAPVLAPDNDLWYGDNGATPIVAPPNPDPSIPGMDPNPSDWGQYDLFQPQSGGR